MKKTKVKERVKLKFMVVPMFLITHCYVPDPVKVKIIDPEAIFLTGILGESGRKMVKKGIPFYFTKKLAEHLNQKGNRHKDSLRSNGARIINE